MKTIKSLMSLMGLIVMISTMSFASPGDETDAQDALRTQILKFVKDAELEKNGITEEKVLLQFLVTNSNEIVVLSTGTSNDYLDSFIKGNLNYKKVKHDPGLKKGKYNIEILFKYS